MICVYAIISKYFHIFKGFRIWKSCTICMTTPYFLNVQIWGLHHQAHCQEIFSIHTHTCSYDFWNTKISNFVWRKRGAFTKCPFKIVSRIKCFDLKVCSSLDTYKRVSSHILRLRTVDIGLLSIPFTSFTRWDMYVVVQCANRLQTVQVDSLITLISYNSQAISLIVFLYWCDYK